MTRNMILKMRDEKAKPHLVQYAPVWLVEEKVIMEDQSVIFHAVFQHNLYKWVKRRYLYDAANNILYHKGQIEISEDEALEIQEQEPYIVATVADIPNAYGG